MKKIKTVKEVNACLDDACVILSKRFTENEAVKRVGLIEGRFCVNPILGSSIRHPGVRLCVWYRYDEKFHNERPFYCDSIANGGRVSHLMGLEANLLGLIVEKIAGEDFEVEFEGDSYGMHTYFFVPKEIPGKFCGKPRERD